jgi:hypothetical protein
MLLSTARSINGGDTNPLGGIRVAALGNTAIVDGTDPGRVVVTEGGLRSAEPFDLKFRVIPPTYEVESARIEYRAEGQTVGPTIPVTLPGGSGRLPLQAGFTFPKHPGTGAIARPRLVINPDTPAQLLSGPRNWNTSDFQVTLAGDERNDLAAGEWPPLVAAGETAQLAPWGDAIAGNSELARRKEVATAENPAQPFTLAWTQEGGEAINPQTLREEDGVFEATLKGTPVVGLAHRITARAGSVVLGSAELPMLPGPAEQLALSYPGGVPPSMPIPAEGMVPADGRSELVLTVEARDGEGNLVQDETPVSCTVEGTEEAYGEIVEGTEDPETLAGRATCRYRAGTIHKIDTVKVEVDGVEAEIPIFAVPLVPTLTLDRATVQVGEEFEATLSVEAGLMRPADGTPVAWMVKGAVGSADRVLTGGQARARLRFSEEGAKAVWAVVGTSHAAAEIEVTAAPSELEIEQGTKVLAGDKTSDGTALLRGFDGSPIERGYHAVSRMTIRGGVPGETVRLELGTFDAPNREPEARYLMESLSDGVVPDYYGRHPAQASEGVTLETDADTGVPSYRFSGADAVRIPANGPLAQAVGLEVALLVNPEGEGGGGLVRREGSFNLDLIPAPGGHRVRLVAQLGGEGHVLESQAVIPSGAWSEVRAGFLGGKVSLKVGEETRDVSLVSVDAGSGDLVVGEGFAGRLDDLRLFHSSGSSPPLLLIDTAEGGQETAEAVFDETGTAFFDVRSTGAMAGGPPVFDPDGDTNLQAALRSYFVGWRTHYLGRVRPGAAPFILYLHDLVAASSYLLEGLFVGSSADSDVPATLADVLWSTAPTGVTNAITMGRDVIFALERVREGATTKMDVLTLTLFAVSVIAAAVTAKKLRAAGRAATASQVLERMKRRGKALANMARWTARAATNGDQARRLEKTLELLTEHGDEVADATLDVIEHTEVSWRHMVHLERTLKNAGSAAPEVIRALKNVLVQNADKGPEILRTTLAVTRTADRVSLKVVSAATKVAKAIRAAKDVKEAPNGPNLSIPGMARLRNWLKNFPAPGYPALPREILERLDDITDESTEGIRFIATQLGVARKPHVFVADATEAVIRYAKQVGRKVKAFERKVQVPGSSTYSRQYDLSYPVGNDRFLDIDVKNWIGGFIPRRSEAWKLQKDIVIKFLGDGNFENLRWVVPKSVLQRDGNAIRKWMLEQFDSPFVKKKIPLKSARDEAQRLFQNALSNSGLLGSLD